MTWWKVSSLVDGETIARTVEDIGDDIRLLLEFHDADDHLQLGAAEMARLVELGWIVVIHEGIVLDAGEVAAEERIAARDPV